MICQCHTLSPKGYEVNILKAQSATVMGMLKRYLFNMLYGALFIMGRCVPPFLCSAVDWTKGLVHAKHMLQPLQVYGQHTESVEMSVSGFLKCAIYTME